MCARARRLAALGMLVGLTAGCALFRGAPEAPAKLADRMRLDPVPYERLAATAAEAPRRHVLWLREAWLAELAIGATTEQVRRRWGEPTRVRVANGRTWWEYDEVYPKPFGTPEPEPSDAALDERREPNAARVGMNLRLMFVDPPAPPAPLAPMATPMPAPAPTAAAPSDARAPAPADPALAEPALGGLGVAAGDEATPAPLPTPTPKPPKVLAHIQAWAPARFQTRSLVRVLDPAARVMRKYGKAPKILAWGREGGEVWLYPAANVAFVVTPEWPEQPRFVAGTLVGFQEGTTP